MLKPISAILPHALHPGTIHQMRSQAVCDAAAAVLREEFPNHRALINVKYFKDSCLWMDASTSSLAAEIRFREKDILRQIHQRLGRQGVVEKMSVR